MLDFCAEQAPVALDYMKAIAKKCPLVVVAYYGTLLSLMDEDELIHQVNLQQQAYKKHLGKQGRNFASPLPKNLLSITMKPQ